MNTVQSFFSWTAGLIWDLFSWAALSLSDIFLSVTGPVNPNVVKLFSDTFLNRVVFCLSMIYVIAVNILALAMYGTDKSRSRKTGKRRISEAALLRVCFFGGAAGAFIGMQLFRHKTNHTKFVTLVPLMLIVQLLLGGFILGFLGFCAFS